jgi:hypothetical protein
VERLETITSLNLENCGFSICISLATSWISWDDFVTTTIGCVGSKMGTTSSIDTMVQFGCCQLLNPYWV